MYVLKTVEGLFYIGHTEALDARVLRHNAPGDPGAYTRKHGPWRLVWSEEHADRKSAMSRERQIKAMKSARWIRERLLNR